MIECEGLAIVEGVKHFRVYLEGVPIRIETDPNPHTQLLQLKDSHGRIARWILALQPYNYTMAYRPGRRNGNVMGLQENMVLVLVKGRCQGWLSCLSLASLILRKGSSLQNHKRKYTNLHTEPQNLITQVTDSHNHLRRELSNNLPRA